MAAKTISPPLFQIHRFTKKSAVLSADLSGPIRDVTDCL